jgi:hypothetical protein
MTRLGRRRVVAIVLTAAAAGGIAAFLLVRHGTLRDAAYDSGWLLLCLCAFLALYNLRKKLTYPPLLSSAAWLQLHVYAGLLAAAVFLLHVGLAVPGGVFETLLALLFAGVTLSGIGGLVLSRVAPRRLSARGGEVVFERIPALIRGLRQEAEEMVSGLVEEAHARTLADFYASRLAWFLAGPRHLGAHLLQSGAPRRRLLDELAALGRYCDEAELPHARRLAEIIERKDTLDHHYAVQGAVKTWLFVHVPLTFMMLIFALLHVILVYGFAGTHR